MKKSILKYFFLGTILSIPYKLSPKFHFFLFKILVKFKLISILQDPVLNCVKGLLKKGNIVIDVGANRGTYSFYFKNLVGGNGEVYSFEPQRKIYNQLKDNLKNTCNIFNNAISDINGTQIFYEHTEGAGPSSSLEKHDDLIIDGLTKKTKVKTLTLDMFCRDLNIVPNFIKIDAEGHDLNIINGSNQIIQEYKPILIFEFFPNIQNMDKNNKTILFLKNNYEIRVIEKNMDLYEYLLGLKAERVSKFKGQENINIICIPKS
ncbi:FkbM family methyltransferase [Alphaproteobacteria bacterium]|nr:FkbM family methyltransferase [Alphaproteobacteria bacterium]